jgi:hypothetical protein
MAIRSMTASSGPVAVRHIGPLGHPARGELRIRISGGPDIATAGLHQGERMSESLLRQHWLSALDAAAEAVEASARAHTLPAPESGGHRRLLAAERAWVETVDWSAFEPVNRGTIAILEPRRLEVPAAGVIKPAA